MCVCVGEAGAHGDCTAAHRFPWPPDLPAGISSAAFIAESAGDTSGATLQVMRPDNMSDDAVATYLIQAYSDAGATTKVGSAALGGWGSAEMDMLMSEALGQGERPGVVAA